jgi:hypothetical protein
MFESFAQLQVSALGQLGDGFEEAWLSGIKVNLEVIRRIALPAEGLVDHFVLAVIRIEEELLGIISRG